MVTKKEVTKELHNFEELRRITTTVLKGRYLKIFATIAGRRTTCPGIVGPRKSESNVATLKKEMEDECDAEVLCAIEKGELALMAMMR